MNITQKPLGTGEYFSEVRPKDTIYLHHTAGSHRPDWAIDGWAHDRSKSGGSLPVATAYVIGGVSTTDRNAEFDGKIYQAFPDNQWAHHLGLHAPNNSILNAKSVAIEICNYGPCTRTSDGKFINYVGREIPADMVGTLDKPFRGFTFYHKYTPKQLESLRLLIIDIAHRFDIDLKKGLKPLIEANAEGAFEMSQDALKGLPGLWTHTNVLQTKSDCWPQPELITLIKSL